MDIINSINDTFLKTFDKTGLKGGKEKVPESAQESIKKNMNTMNNIVPPSLSLEKNLTSYNLLILFFFLFCIVIICLYIFNPKGLNKAFG